MWRALIVLLPVLAHTQAPEMDSPAIASPLPFCPVRRICPSATNPKIAASTPPHIPKKDVTSEAIASPLVPRGGTGVVA